MAEKVLFQPASKKQEKFIQSDSFVTVYGGAAGCVDADTEFLTPQGWKKISDYVDGDLVAEYVVETGEVGFTLPKEFIKAPNETFKRMKSKGLDFCLSEDHLVPYWEDGESEEPLLKFWQDIQEEHNTSSEGFNKLIKTSFKYDGDGVQLSEGELRLQVAVQAFGEVLDTETNKTKMLFHDKRRYDRLKWILSTWELPHIEVGSRYNSNKSPDTSYEIIVYPKLTDKVFDSKYFNVNEDQVKIIQEEVGYWSGTIYENGLVNFKTKDKGSADFIQFVFHASGYNTDYYYNEDTEEYKVSRVLGGNGFRKFIQEGYKQEIEEVKSVDGFQYCFDLNDGMFLARRNGCVFITHNSGKSYMGLMRFLLYVHDANFFGYVFRLNATDMKGGGGLFQTACRMYQAYDKRVKYTKQPMCIYFPSGATINFTGLDGDSGLESIRGIEISAAMIDEGSQHIEDNVFWVISRLRTKAKMIPNIWITCNPDPDSFLRKWLEAYYLYPKGTYVDGELVEGRPDPEKDGVLRWFLRIGDGMVWGDSKEELVAKYKDQFPIDRKSGLTTCQPRSFRFISATCHDNPPLLESDPNYVSNLLNLPRIEKERLYHGKQNCRLVKRFASENLVNLVEI